MRQAEQAPHVMWLSAETKSPTETWRTSAPTSTTVPANSWPRVTGGWIRPAAQPSQRWMWRSVPQTLAASTSTTTSVGVGRGSATSSRDSPGSDATFRSACMAESSQIR